MEQTMISLCDVEVGDVVTNTHGNFLVIKHSGDSIDLKRISNIDGRDTFVGKEYTGISFFSRSWLIVCKGSYNKDEPITIPPEWVDEQF